MSFFSAKTAFPDAHDDGIWSVCWSSAGHIVTGSCDETVRSFSLIDDGKGFERWHLYRGHQLGITSVTINAEAGIAASSSLDSHIRIWSLDKGLEVLDIDAGPIEAWTVTLSPDGKHIASGTQGGVVNLWSATSGKKEHAMPTGGKFVMSVAYAPDGKHIACGQVDGTVCLFDVEAQRLTQCMHPPICMHPTR